MCVESAVQGCTVPKRREMQIAQVGGKVNQTDSGETQDKFELR